MKAIYIEARDPLDGGVNVARRRVTAVMSSPVTSVPTSAHLDDALQMMVCADLRHLAVVDDDGRFTGILSDRMIEAEWAADPGCLSWRSAVSVLEPGPATVSPAAHVVEAARLMRTNDTDAVAVVDDAGMIVGIVTGSDLIGQLTQ